MKLITFDIDGTLSDHGAAIPANVAEKLRELEDQGIQIALVSGKPAYYLAGLARGMGLHRAKLIGENGCVIFDSSSLEETRIADRLLVVDQIEKQVIEQYGDRVWLQPNRVALTIFPKDRKEVPQVAKTVKNKLGRFEDQVLLYEHVDAVDVLPLGVDKGVAIKKMLQYLPVKREDLLAVGDSHNDLPMFKAAGNVCIIGDTLDFPSAQKFHHVLEALNSPFVKDFLKS